MGKKQVKLYLGRSIKDKIRKTQARLATARLGKKWVCDPALKQLWSPKQRAAAQLEQLGIAYDSNKTLNHSNATQYSELVAYYEQVSKQQAPRQPKHQSQSEILYLTNIFQKYGTNWKRAVRDRKLNYLQWTETQLAKKYNQWLQERNKPTEHKEK